MAAPAHDRVRARRDYHLRGGRCATLSPSATAVSDWFSRIARQRPARLALGAFALIILHFHRAASSCPGARRPGNARPFMDAFFTATSAVCVTGLSTVDTAHVLVAHRAHDHRRGNQGGRARDHDDGVARRACDFPSHRPHPAHAHRGRGASQRASATSRQLLAIILVVSTVTELTIALDPVPALPHARLRHPQVRRLFAVLRASRPSTTRDSLPTPWASIRTRATCGCSCRSRSASCSARLASRCTSTCCARGA